MASSMGAFVLALREQAARESARSQQSAASLQSEGRVNGGLPVPSAVVESGGEDVNPEPVGARVLGLQPSSQCALRLVVYDSDTSENTLDLTQPCSASSADSEVRETLEALLTEASAEKPNASPLLVAGSPSVLTASGNAPVESSGSSVNPSPTVGASEESPGSSVSSVQDALNISTESAKASYVFSSPSRSSAATVYVIGEDLASEESDNDVEVIDSVTAESAVSALSAVSTLSQSIDCVEETVATSPTNDLTTSPRSRLAQLASGSPTEADPTESGLGGEQDSIPLLSLSNCVSPLSQVSHDGGNDEPDVPTTFNASMSSILDTSENADLDYDCFVVLERLPDEKAPASSGRYPERLRNAQESGQAAARTSHKKSVSFLPPTPVPPADDSPRRLRLKAALRGIRLPPPSAPPRHGSVVGSKTSSVPLTLPRRSSAQKKLSVTEQTPTASRKRARELARLDEPSGEESVSMPPKASEVSPIHLTSRRSRSQSNEQSSTAKRRESVSTDRSVHSPTAVSDKDEEEEETFETSQDDQSPKSSPSKPPRAKRPKGDRETRLRAEWLSNPKKIFASATLKKAKQSGRPKAGPVADVPPRTQADCDRAPASDAALTARTTHYINDRTAQIDLRTLQHLERLHILRLLIIRAYGDEHDVEPLLRILEQNGRANNDPLPVIAAVLDPDLIDTRLRTQTSSAHMLLFNYIVPLFMQRWAVMAAGTTAREQWRSLGQNYNNWNGLVRWVECVLVAPAETATLAANVLAESALVQFQRELGALFVSDPTLLRRWVHLRRCSVAVADHKGGDSLFVDLIVSPSALWLAATDEHEALVEAAYAQANQTALDSVVSERVIYPAPSIYRTAITTLTELLASAATGMSHLRRVDRALSTAPSTRPADETWIQYNGSDDVIRAGITQLQTYPPGSVTADRNSGSAGALTLTLTCHWPSTSERPAEAIVVSVPIASGCVSNTTSEAPREEQLVSAAGGDLPNCLCISGLRATFDLVRLLNTLAEFGNVSAVYMQRAEGKIFVTYDDAQAVQRAVTCFYASIPRQQQQHCLHQSLPEPLPVGTELLALSAIRNSVVDVGEKSGSHVTKTDLDGTLFQIATFATNLDTEIVSPALLDEVRVHVQAAAAFALDVVPNQSDKSILTFSPAPFESAPTRKVLAKLFSTPSSASSNSYLASLQVLILQHLRAHPQDGVFVTPLDWFDVGAGLGAAAQPQPLYVNGSVRNPTDCRVLLIPALIESDLVLVVVGFPWSFQCLHSALFAPNITVCSSALAQATLRKLLVFLFVRLEALLSEGCPVRRGALAVVELQSGTTDCQQLFIFQLVHAARLALYMLTSSHGVVVRASAFADAVLLGDTHAFLRLLSAAAAPSSAQQIEIDTMSHWNRRLHELALLDTTQVGALFWDHSGLYGAYERYLAISCMRRNDRQDWTVDAAIDAFLTTETVTRCYVYVNETLRRRGGVFQRALYSRLQQLHRRGFYVTACNEPVIQLRRGFTENCWLKLPSLTLYSPTGCYANSDETKRMPEGWKSVPLWISHHNN